MTSTTVPPHPAGIDAGRGAAGRATALAGVRGIAPMAIGLVPLAIAIGTTAARADVPPLVGWASSPLLYGASGQLTLLQVLGDGGPVPLAIAATVVVNLQMLLYGTAMRPHWRELSRWRRAGSAQLLVGPLFAVATDHHRGEPDARLRHIYYLAAGLTLWIAWAALTAVGYALGGAVAAAPALTLLTPLALVALAVRTVVDRATLAALAVGALAAIAATSVPHGLGFVGAGLAGVAAGTALDGRGRAKTSPTTGEVER
jgi:branched chain amino acid efflux pump